MRIIKTQAPRILLIMVGALLFTGLPVIASDGARLFQQNCTSCHSSAVRITTSPDKITTLLTSGSIKQHRFTLDDKAIQLIAEYIKQQK